MKIENQCITVSRGDETWATPLSDGSFGVVLFNRASVNQSVTAKWEYIFYFHINIVLLLFDCSNI